MLTTTRFGLNKPQTTDARSALRTALTTNADLLETALDLVTPTTVTALPTTSLFDGKLVYLQTTNMASVGIRWLMRYRLSTTKWEYVGGAPWTFSTDNPETRGPRTAGSSAAVLLNSQPIDRASNPCTAPAAGIYRAELQFVAQRDSGSSDGAITALLASATGGTAQIESGSIGPIPTANASQTTGIVVRAEGETPDLASGTLIRGAFRLWDDTIVAILLYKRLRIQPVLLHT